MRASELKVQIQAARRANRPVMIWGAPGVGKTSVVSQAASEDKCNLMPWHLTLMDSVDLRGVPKIVTSKKFGEVTRWCPPEELMFEGDWYLFIDELPQAMISTTNAATRLIHERKVGAVTLPDSVYILAAGNAEEHMAAANRMPTHVANRFIHLTMDVHHGDWIEWADVSGIDPRVIAFIKYRPQLLHVFDPRSKEKAFASPRTWEFMSQMMVSMEAPARKAAKKDQEAQAGWSSDSAMELSSGIIGKQAAVEFVGFLRIMEKLVSIESILLSPEKAALPSDPSILYALVYALAEHANRGNLKQVVKYIDRLPKEFGFLFFRRVDQVNADLKKTKEFIGWVSKNQHLA